MWVVEEVYISKVIQIDIDLFHSNCRRRLAAFEAVIDRRSRSCDVD